MNLFNARTEKHMTMKTVAQEAGISESFYSCIENGKRRPSIAVAKRIAAVRRSVQDVVLPFEN